MFEPEGINPSEFWFDSSNPIMRLDRHGNVGNANPAYFKTFSIDKQITVEHPAAEVFHTISPDTEYETLVNQMNMAAQAQIQQMKQKTQTIDYPVIKAVASDGKLRWFKLKPTFTYSLIGKPGDTEKSRRRGLQIEFDDVTSEKQIAALNAASDYIHNSDHPEEVLDRIRTILHSVLPYDRANIMLFEPQRKGSPILTTKYKWGYEKDVRYDIDFTPEMDISQKPLLQEMIKTHNPVLVSDTFTAPELYKINPKSKNPTRSYMGAPIIVNGEIVGFINLNHLKPGFYDENDLKLLETFTEKIAIALKNADLSGKDSLTGLLNHGHSEQNLEAEVERAVRRKDPLSILFLDIDLFKETNDSWGHQSGDVVLRALSQFWQNELRRLDILGRWGGEEFIVGLPDTMIGDAFTVADKLRRNTFNFEVLLAHDTRIRKSISVGMALFQNFDTRGYKHALSTLIEGADDALYVVKQNGRNGIGIFIPKVDMEIHGHHIQSADQVITLRPIRTTQTTKNLGIASIPTTTVEDVYWEVEVFSKEETRHGIDTTNQKPYTYKRRVLYNAYSTPPNANNDREHLIFKVNPDSHQESEQPIARLHTGPKFYLFDWGHDYEESLKKGEQPEDSFTWVNILFPKSAHFRKDKKEEFIL